MRQWYNVSIKPSQSSSVEVFFQLLQAKIGVPKVLAGDDAPLSVEFSGKRTDLKEVYLTVREYPDMYPRIPLKLDPASNKNRWIFTINVPYDAPPDTYHLDINAIDKDGKEIVTKGFETNETGKAGTIELKVD